MKKPIFFTGVVMTLFCCYTARGQSIGTKTLNAAGHTATVNNYVHEWSVGESILVNTFSTSSLTVTQGVLQPVDFPLDVPSINLDEHLHVYPNPATATVYLKYNLLNDGTLSYVLQDITGKKLKEQVIEQSAAEGREAINMSPYADGSYMLNVNYRNAHGVQETISFKIQKIS